MSHRLDAKAAHEFGGIGLDRTKPIRFRVNGRRIHGFAGDTVLSALLAAGVDTYGRFARISLGLTDRFAPLVRTGSDSPLPSERLLASDGLDLVTLGPRQWFAPRRSLGHDIDGIPDAPWASVAPSETLATDLLIVGGGVAGLAAADAAARAGHSVILVERRPWLGGDARYFGPVGDEASPEAVTTDLVARIAGHAGITVLATSEVLALHGSTARLHRIENGRGSIVSVTAQRIVLATGSQQRLPVFGGNRHPGIVSAISAYHMAKRFGVAPGRRAIVVTQSNYGYRLAMRLNDAGIPIARIVDARINPQSRFVDFAKASGLTLIGGQSPVSVLPTRNALQATFATTGSAAPALSLETDAVIVSGPFYPDLGLWMRAGGNTQWVGGRLVARGHVEHVALAGAAAGYRTLAACLASGRAAIAELFGTPSEPIEDNELGAPYETPEAQTMIGPIVAGIPAFYDSGASLISRPDPTRRAPLTAHAQAPSLGDVAASVELNLISPADAGAVAEERGAPGGDLAASDWRPPEAAASGTPSWLTARLGPDAEEIHLIVDTKRRFERGALVYANTAQREPVNAIGVIVREADAGIAGGIALLARQTGKPVDRYIVETLDGPSPARIRAS